MNSKAKGDISEALIFAALVKYGFTVLTPWGDKNRYDLVVDDNGVFIRIQCKTGCIRNGCVNFRTYSVTTKNGEPLKSGYTADEVDLFMVYCPETDKIYAVKQTEVPNDICLLRLEEPKNNQKWNVKMASDFEFKGSITNRPLVQIQ